MGMRYIAVIGSLIALIASQAANIENQEQQVIALQDEIASEEPDTGNTAASEILDAADMAKVLDYIPDIKIELRYSTENNFTGERIYDFTDAYLRYGTVMKLKNAQEQLKQEGLTLLIWDAYRPVPAQFALWNICPDPVYVANPNTGYSSHSKGNTVDVTMVSTAGTSVQMPTDFDDFSPKADRDYGDCTPEEAANAQKLEDIMIQSGFTPYSGEWWHFSDTDDYPVRNELEQ